MARNYVESINNFLNLDVLSSWQEQYFVNLDPGSADFVAGAALRQPRRSVEMLAFAAPARK